MSATRASVLLVIFVGLALATVGLRLEQTRAAARAVKFELKQVEARRELWAVQARMARLRSPERIRERVEQLDSTKITATGSNTTSAVSQ
ncbi:MAG: hypothetical protein ACPGXK_10180 [Phycisphaerae bacterium]